MAIVDILQTVRGIVGELSASKLPPEIIVNQPAGSPAEGEERGRFHLKRTDGGGSFYEWHPTDSDCEQKEAVSDFVETHHFESLGSLVAFLGSAQSASLFVAGAPFEEKRVWAFIDSQHPERGKVSLTCARHPAWERWSEVAGKGDHVDLTHIQLADLLLDNAEDLDEPMIAKVLAQFRAARTVEYSGDHDTGAAMGVRVLWKGSAGAGGEGARATDVQVPREFTAKFPAFVGAWESGEEPDFNAKFRLRVIPPRGSGEDAAPKFRLLWVNARAYEMSASAAVEQAVRDAIGGKAPVYLGSPHAERYVPVRRVSTP